MAGETVTWSIEQLPAGVLRLAFSGEGGFGSDGNPDGKRMKEVIRDALTEYGPTAMIIDLCGFKYRFGDWISAAALTALTALGPGRVCVLATGETATAIRSLWVYCQLDQLIPLVGEQREALQYLSGLGGGRTDAKP